MNASNFRTIMLGFASTLALAAPAMAQDATTPADQDDSIEEIVISTFRRSVQNAIDVKRNADTIVEAISAEDIGRLPDISIAEAIARLPGISSQRTNGQSSAINIRGLSQNLTFATLNGREQVTPNGNRAIEFEQFPSELIGAVEVYKSPKASLIEGGLAGTVNLQTIRPLSRNDTLVNVNVRGSFNDRAGEIRDANKFGYRVSAVYVDQFLDNTFGISIGYARLDQPDVATQFVGFDYPGASNDFNGDGVNDAVNFGFELQESGGKDTRNGVIGTLQWQPNDAFNWELDAYYSKFKSDSYSRGYRVIGTQEINGGNTIVTNPIIENDVVAGGVFSRNIAAPTVPGGGFGLGLQGINDNQFDEDELISIGNKIDYTIDRWAFKADFTYSRADSFFANEVSAILPLAATTGGEPGNPCCGSTAASTPILDDNIVVGIDYNGTNLPVITQFPDFVNQDNLFLSRFGIFPFDNEDELYAISGDVEYEADWGFISTIEAGFRYSDRNADQVRVSADFGNDAGFFQFAPDLPPIAITDQNSSVECFSGEFAANGFPCFIVLDDPRALAEAVVGTITPNQDQFFTRTESYELSEEVIAAYVQANLDTEIAGLRVTGNIGVRVVDTDQSSRSFVFDDRVGTSYTRVLPSANFSVFLTDNDILRLGGSRAISRAPLAQLASGFSIGFNQGAGRLESFPAGNPFLEPFLANQGDISYEHYFENGGIFTVAGFYKHLETFIFDQSIEDFDFAGNGILDFLSETDRGLFEAAGSPTVGLFDGPVNGAGGYIWGLEVGYSQAFDFLPAPFDGLGVTMNYAYTESEIDFTDTRSGRELTSPLPGLSEHVFNATVYYEKDGFSNRLGMRYRSEFVSPQIGIDAQLPFTDNEFVLDYQASYSFHEDGPLGGVTLLFQANNLTDEPTVTYFGQETQTGTIQHFGRQFFFGASYSF